MNSQPFFRISLVVLAALMAACGSGSNSPTACAGDCLSPAGSISVDAGADLRVFEGDEVTLSGTALHSENLPLSYEWSQYSGPRVQIASADQPSARFVAPLLATITETIGIRLTVSAPDGATASDVVEVEIELATAYSPPAPISMASRRADWIALPGESESNDSFLNATVIHLGRAPVSVSAMKGSIGGRDDAKDIYILTVPETGNYVFRFCNAALVCEGGSLSQRSRLSLMDGQFGRMASADDGRRQELEVRLDAGLPYYVEVGPGEQSAVAEPYSLIISGGRSN